MAKKKAARKILKEEEAPIEGPSEKDVVEAPPPRAPREGVAPYKVRSPDSRSIARHKA